MLSACSRPPFHLHLAPRSDKQSQSDRHERDHQKRRILPEGSSRPVLLSPPLTILCACVCTFSSLWNSHVFASSASPMKFIARAAGLQPHSQKPGQDTNSACSDGTLALVVRLCASVFTGWSSRQFEHNTKHLGIMMLVNGMPGIPSGNLVGRRRGWIKVQRVCVF